MNKEHGTNKAEREKEERDREKEERDREIDRLFMRRMKWRFILFVPYVIIMSLSAYFLRKYLGLVQLVVWLEWLGTVSEIAAIFLTFILMFTFCAFLAFVWIYLFFKPPTEDHTRQREESKKKWKKG